MCLSPPLWLTLYRWPRGLGRSSRRFGSPTWTPKPSKASHTFPPETCLMGSLNSHLKEDSSCLVCPHPLGRPGWLAHQVGAWGEWVVLSGNFRNLPEPSRSFQDLPGHTGTVSGHSGHFWTTSRTFRNL